jgi:hypothetical protein
MCLASVSTFGRIVFIFGIYEFIGSCLVNMGTIAPKIRPLHGSRKHNNDLNFCNLWRPLL